jgi:hypothetical protein
MSTSPKHFHCPEDCGENPQPIVQHCGLRLCGRCWVLYGVISIMFLCTPDICE